MAGLPQVLVTRPREDAERWVAQLQARGVPAQALPLIDIAPVLDAQALASIWQRLPGYAAVMFVSGNAVAHFFAAEGPGWPQGLRCLAPGPGTARAVLARGVPPALIDAPPVQAGQFDSEALWEVVGRRPWTQARVLIVRGQGGGDAPSAGRDWMTEQLQRAGAEVDRVAVYRRMAPHFDAQQRQRMVAAQTDGSLWLFSSSEAIGHLPADLQWHHARALATHPRIAQAAGQAGFAQVLQARPTVDDVVASIKSAAS